MTNSKAFKVGIIGFGALGQQILTFLLQQENYQPGDYIFFDDNAFGAGAEHSAPFADYGREEFKHLVFYVGLGYKHLPLRQRIVSELIEGGREAGIFVHKTSFVNPSSTLAPGVIIYPMCNIDQNVTLGAGTILNNSVTVSHDCSIGEACFLAPSTTFSGNVRTEENCFFGTGSLVSNGLHIGANVKVAIGAVLTRNIPAYGYVAGNPGKTLKRSFNIQ